MHPLVYYRRAWRFFSKSGTWRPTEKNWITELQPGACYLGGHTLAYVIVYTWYDWFQCLIGQVRQVVRRWIILLMDKQRFATYAKAKGAICYRGCREATRGVASALGQWTISMKITASCLGKAWVLVRFTVLTCWSDAKQNGSKRGTNWRRGEKDRCISCLMPESPMDETHHEMYSFSSSSCGNQG